VTHLPSVPVSDDRRPEATSEQLGASAEDELPARAPNLPRARWFQGAACVVRFQPKGVPLPPPQQII